MIIFLSYAPEQRDMAEQTKLAIAASGHKVFFGQHRLPVGDEYHLRIGKSGRGKSRVRIPHQPPVGRARLLRAN